MLTDDFLRLGWCNVVGESNSRIILRCSFAGNKNIVGGFTPWGKRTTVLSSEISDPFSDIAKTYLSPKKCTVPFEKSIAGVDMILATSPQYPIVTRYSLVMAAGPDCPVRLEYNIQLLQ